MNNERALVAGADAHQHFLDSQVNIFLFDLKNEASEHGFKLGESWNVQMVTDDEITSLKRLHNPVIYMRLKPLALLHVYQQVKIKLKHFVNKSEADISEADVARDGKNYLAAYPLRNSRK